MIGITLAGRDVVVGGGPGGDNLAASNPFDEPPGPRRPPGTRSARSPFIRSLFTGDLNYRHFTLYTHLSVGTVIYFISNRFNKI